MITYKILKNSLMQIVWLMMGLLVIAQPTMTNAQSMVHVHYNVTTQLRFDGLTLHEFYKKSCDQLNKIQAPLGKITPFKVSGNLKDLEVYTEDLYISPENSFYATHKSGHTLDKSQHSTCEFKVIPNKEITIVNYKLRSDYKFDSSLPAGEQWVRGELPSLKSGVSMAKSMSAFIGFKVRETGKRDRIANLFCDIAELTTPHPDFKTSSCIWRAKPEDRMTFMGYPMELILSSHGQVAKEAVSRKRADKVNLKEAYDASVFQVPKEVLNMPFYANEPNYTQPEKDDDEYCLAEKKKTGINPCLSQAAAMKWCAITKKNTGQDPCENIADEEGDDE